MPGPYPPAHTRLQFQGNLIQASGGGTELFEFGFADNSGMTAHDAAVAADGVMALHFGDPNAQNSTYAQYVSCRAEEIDAAGHVTSSYSAGAHAVGGAANGAVCTILSCAITTETDTPDEHGSMVQGRFYPPAYPGLEGATILSGSIDAYVGAWAVIMNAMLEADLVPVVASVTSGGQLAPITALTADNLIDTQRRRKNHLTPVRTGRHTLGS